MITNHKNIPYDCCSCATEFCEASSEMLGAIHDTNDWLIRNGLSGTAHQQRLAELVAKHASEATA